MTSKLACKYDLLQHKIRKLATNSRMKTNGYSLNIRAFVAKKITQKIKSDLRTFMNSCLNFLTFVNPIQNNKSGEFPPICRNSFDEAVLCSQSQTS